MPTRFWVFAVVVFGTLLTGVGFAQPATRGNTLPSVQMLNRYGLKMAWWNQANINPGRDTVRYLTADEQIVYAQTTAGTVTAVDMETGRQLWSIQLGRPDAPSYPVTSNNELALVLSGLDLFAVDKWTGNLVWRIRVPGQPTTSPVMDEEQVYVGGLDGSVYAFDLEKIRKLFETNKLPEWSNFALNWRYKTGAVVRTPPVPWRNLVNFASEDRSLYSVTKDQHSLKFQLETDAPVSAPMTQSEGYLFMASEDFNIYAVNLVNGKIRWQFVSGVPVLLGPKAVGENLYVTPKRSGLYQLSTISGRQRWWQPNLTEFLAESLHYTFATNERGDVVILDRASGGPLGVLPLRHFSVCISNERTDRLIMATAAGQIIMIHERGQEFPIYHKNPEERPLLPEFATEEQPAKQP